MTEAVMSADVLRSTEASRTTVIEEARPEAQPPHVRRGWSPESFAREQIRALVRQVFVSNGASPVRQVVFSMLEPETDVRGLCWHVGDTLALEARGSIAVVGQYPRLVHRAEVPREEPVACGSAGQSIPLRQIATRIRGDLWLVPHGMGSGGPGTATSLYSFLNEVRRQFEYSIVQGPPVGESTQAAALAQCADGIILVLSAQRTRRAAARTIKQALEAAHVRILGTVLSDRAFPVPEALYRWL